MNKPYMQAEFQNGFNYPAFLKEFSTILAKFLHIPLPLTQSKIRNSYLGWAFPSELH